MNQARYWHGCATTSYKGIKSVFAVGGYDENYNKLDSFEILNVKENKWTSQSSKLPKKLYGLQVVPANSPQYLLYVVGGADENWNPQSEIYGLTKNLKWEKLGNLSIGRYSHASVSIKLEDIPG